MLRKLGLAHIPEDRHHMGLVLKFEEYENSILGYHRDDRYGKGMFLNPEAIRKDAIEKIEKYDIRPPNDFPPRKTGVPLYASTTCANMLPTVFSATAGTSGIFLFFSI